MTEWLPGFIALGGGVMAAIATLYGSNKKRVDATPLANALDLETQLEHHIEHLRDMKMQRGCMPETLFAKEQERVEALAVQTMRALDALTDGAAQKEKIERLKKTKDKKQESSKASTGFLARHPQLKGFLFGGGTMLMLALLWTLVNINSAPRQENGSLTGNAQSESAAGQSDKTKPHFPLDDEMRALGSTLRKNPNDIDALVRLGHKLLAVQAVMEADVVTRQALKIAPNHPEARVHAAITQHAQGDSEGALAALDKIIDADPLMAEAWFFRGMISMQSGKSEMAQAAWRKFVEVAPDGPRKERIRGFLEGKGMQMPQP